MTGGEFISSCKRGIKGTYLFYGDEEYMKNAAFALAEKSVIGDDGDRDMDIVRISCSDSQDGWFDLLRQSCESFGFFSDRKIVELKYLTKSQFEKEEEFCGHLDSMKDSEDIVLIVSLSDDFDVGTIKAPSAAFKKLVRSITPVFFEKQTPAKLNAWVIKRFTKEGLICDAISSGELINCCACDMYALSCECEKLIAYMKNAGISKLDPDLIKYIVSPMTSEGSFEFSNAITNRNYIKAIELFKAMEKRKERPEMIFSEISSVITCMYSVRVLADAGYSKSDIARELSLHEYRVGLYMTAALQIGSKGLASLVEKCHDADIKIKSTPLSSYTVIQNLIFEVCR